MAATAVAAAVGAAAAKTTTSSVSQHLTRFLHHHGVRTVFGVPGAYHIDFLDRVSRDPHLSYVLASHEGGAAYMAQAYGQVTRKFGVACVTAGPGALNAITGLASAKADGDSVLLVHGEVPAASRGVGALQDCSEYGTDIAGVMSHVCGTQHVVNDGADFAACLARLTDDLMGDCGTNSDDSGGGNGGVGGTSATLSAAPDGVEDGGEAERSRTAAAAAAAAAVTTPVHLMVGTNAFPQSVAAAFASRPVRAGDDAVRVGAARAAAAEAAGRIAAAERCIVLVGHGVYQADAFWEVDALLRRLHLPVLVTGRGAACVDHALPSFLGHHGVFSHARAKAYLGAHAAEPGTLLLVLGSGLGEFATNSWSQLLRAVPSVLHVNTDPRTFGRLGHKPVAAGAKGGSATTGGSDSSGDGGGGGDSLGFAVDVKMFARELNSALDADPAAAVRVAAAHRAHTDAFLRTAPPLHARQELLAGSGCAELSGQRLVRDLSDALHAAAPRDHVVNVVADTGNAKMHAAHYVTYRPGWRCILNSGQIDTLGFGLSAAVGAAVGSSDAGERAWTVGVVGDGGLLANNELNALATNAACDGLPLVLFVLNDSALSYVHQGFAAVMERPMDESRFRRPVDVAALAGAFGLRTEVVTSPGQVDAAFVQRLFAERRPVVVDCRLADGIIGPGYERYNRVRSLIGKTALSEEEMGKLLLAESGGDGDAPEGGEAENAVADDAGGQAAAPPQQRGGGAAAGSLRADEEEEFCGGGTNRAHLYGVIYDVFEGCIDPKKMTKERSGVQPDLSFGLGVSSFEDDTADIGDAVYVHAQHRRLIRSAALARAGKAVSDAAVSVPPPRCYFDGRFFVRRTDPGEARAPPELQNKRVKEGTASTYRTSYSLGVARPPEEMRGRRFVFDATCNGDRTMRDMLTEFIGTARREGEPGRVLGFQGLVEYAAFLGTSLSKAPSQGENILPVIDDYARPSVPTPNVSGMVMGFVRTAVEDFDPPHAHALYERMFFDNPRDNDGRLGEAGAASDHGSHWISHTHGVVLPPGQSIFGGEIGDDDEEMQRRLMRLATDADHRRAHLAHCQAQKWHDCGHVIPSSALRRYFFTLFDVHHVDVFNPQLRR